MPSADVGRQNGHKVETPGGVAVDDVGRIRWDGPPNGAPPADIAARACLAIGPLLRIDVTPVTVQCLGGESSRLGMVMLREELDGAARFRSGTARGASDAAAVVHAVVAALDAEEGVLQGTVERWAASPDTEAVTVIRGNDVVAAAGDPGASAAHCRLSSSLPAPGRLAVGTEQTEYRVLRLPDAALALSASPGSSVFVELDDWMSVVEAHRAGSEGDNG